jgi:hypothetical protein
MAAMPIPRFLARAVPAALALAAALAPAAPARADSAVTCHCYRDRTFDLERPAAADPYVLATTRSSLLSAAYGVPKADLVRTAMTGTAADDLWIAHWGAARAGRTAGDLLAARQLQGSWKRVFRGLEAGKDVEAAIAAAEAGPALVQDPAADALARLAVDDVLGSRLGADPAAVKAFRAEGASSEETVLAAVLQRHLGAPALPLLRHVRAGGTTWGKLLHECGLGPKDLDGVVRGLVR